MLHKSFLKEIKWEFVGTKYENMYEKDRQKLKEDEKSYCKNNIMKNYFVFYNIKLE